MVETRGTAVEVKLPSRLGFEKVAMGTAASVAKLMGFPDDRIEDLKTALAEACINAIEHGNLLNDNLCVGVILSASDASCGRCPAWKVLWRYRRRYPSL
jgi:serine/threonine-protein kinase RsbW